MFEFKLIYDAVREEGQFAPLVVLVVLYIVRKNDLNHIVKDVAEVKKLVLEHLKWHSEKLPPT